MENKRVPKGSILLLKTKNQLLLVHVLLCLIFWLQHTLSENYATGPCLSRAINRECFKLLEWLADIENVNKPILISIVNCLVLILKNF
ncbi:hypothetical protein B0O99DRAFT_272656 [Bisporella sp. PMI_857]|nr:hypothetical protein B0O99DRAFT_272656 [Bisporella sp. PMI_857]